MSNALQQPARRRWLSEQAAGEDNHGESSIGIPHILIVSLAAPMTRDITMLKLPEEQQSTGHLVMVMLELTSAFGAASKGRE